MTLRCTPSLAGRIALLCGVALLSFGAGTARGDLIPNLELLSVQADPNHAGEYTWTYQVDLTNSEFIKSGSTAGVFTSTTDYVTIYDFNGFDASTGYSFSATSPYDSAVGTTAAGDWYFQSQNTGVTPSLVKPDDNSNVPNLTFEYLGAVSGKVSGSQTLGYFTIDSSFNTVNLDGEFSTQAHKVGGGIDQNIGYVGVPGAVPEPPAMAMLASTITLAWTWRRRRTRRG